MYYQKNYDVRYNLVTTYEGFDPEYDKVIEKIIGRPSGGSGYGEHGRDISFWFGTRAAIERALARIKKSKKDIGISVWDTDANDDESEITDQFL